MMQDLTQWMDPALHFVYCPEEKHFRSENYKRQKGEVAGSTNYENEKELMQNRAIGS